MGGHESHALLPVTDIITTTLRRVYHITKLACLVMAETKVWLPPPFTRFPSQCHCAPIQGPATAPAPNKLAMSRALGAAFLSHQVEQLEKSVTRGPASGNWRDRRQPQADLGAHHNPNRRSTIATHGAKPRPASGQKQPKKEYTDRERDQPEQRHREKEKPTKMSASVADKDADLVIVDASVLVHALYQVKKWCRDGREEIIIIPLEGQSSLSHIWGCLSRHRRSAQHLGSSQERHKFPCPESPLCF